jgi:hypothetical protein
MICITAVLGSHEFGLRKRLGAQGRSQISNGRENFASGSAVLPMLDQGLQIELSDFNAGDATLKADYLWKVVEVVIGGIPTVLEVHCMCLYMTLGRILLQGSISMNLFDPITQHVDF